MAFELPALPFSYNALAGKGMCQETLELHHDKHHQAYVTALNGFVEAKPDRASWAAYDPLELVRTAKERPPVLIDQGLADQFLKEQLKPELFQEAAQNAGQELILNLRPDYDHSYYFVASFIADHLRYFVSKLR